jgi:predicted protein tyrosine phosphatase
MNVLFICSANLHRSRTAEIHFQNKYPEQRFRSAGTNKYLSERHGGVHLRQYMLDIADRIICMEHTHKELIERHIGPKYRAKIEILHIEDTGIFMSEDLIKRLEEKFTL